MNHYLLFVPALLAILSGFLMLVVPGKTGKLHPVLTEAAVILTSVIVWILILNPSLREDGAVLFYLAGNLKVFFRLDGTGMVFAGLIAVLWPLATLYAFEYMEHDKKQRQFFGFYTMTYGVTLGIAFAGNLVTLYLFYELLTLVTFPLVLHERTKAAIRASRKYLYYSLGGAAFAFLGLVFVLSYGKTTDFVLGGVMKAAAANPNLILFMYVLAFFGFGVKAAIFPFHGWLPAASVAPTPVTALLHAVAVVKSGAFAIIRLTYFCYGTDVVKGTWAHYVVLAAVLFTIAFGSTRAVRETHVKRRLAYSTISNLSYVLLGAVMMSPMGMVAALSHLVFHAFMKICGFFCVGAVMHHTGRNYLYEYDGLGRKMPIVFTCFTIAGLSLMGIPLFAGFISKWNIAEAALQLGGKAGILSVFVLLYSALATGIYMLTVSVRAFFPVNGYDAEGLSKVHEPGIRMLIPIVCCAAVVVFFGIYSRPLLEFLTETAGGIV